jgi:hypothetical protein
MKLLHIRFVLALLAFMMYFGAASQYAEAAIPVVSGPTDTLYAAFTVEFEGAISGGLNGKAMFDARTVDGDSYFKIILYRHRDDRNYEAFNIVGFDMLLPSEGQVVLPDNEQFTAAYMAVSDGATKVGALETGWIRFEKVGGNLVVGAFELEGGIMGPDGDDPFRVSGRFHAPKGDERKLPTAFR